MQHLGLETTLKSHSDRRSEREQCKQNRAFTSTDTIVRKPPAFTLRFGRREWTHELYGLWMNGTYLNKNHRHSGQNEVQTRNPNAMNSAHSGFLPPQE